MDSEQRCEESKCLSTGLIPADGSGAAAAISDDNNNQLLFNCYAQGPGTLYPYLCADDYVGVRIANEDVASSTYPDLRYYTCCPPDYDYDDADSSDDSDDDDKVPPMRECEDPQEADPAEVKSKDWTPTATCQANSSSHPFGRKTTQIPGFPEAYMCCSIDISPPVDLDPSEDNEGEGVADSAMPEITLVNPPYGEGDGVADLNLREVEGAADSPGTAEIDPSIGEDDLGENPLQGIRSSNDISEPNECYSFPCHSCVVENSFGDLQAMNCFNDVYKYPQVINTEGNTATYQCCSVPQDTNSSFVLTSTAYRATVWTQFTLALIASLMASLLIVSIGRSLFLAKKNSSANTSRVNGPDYSAYNLYLVLLAIPNLAYNLFMLRIVTETFLNGWIPANDALITLSATTNQYTNAIIASEVLVLLRRTKDCQRYVPPSFKKAGIQFGIVTAFATALGILWLLFLHYCANTSSGCTVRATVAIPREAYSISVFFLLVVILPAVYLLWVCFEIWHKQLLPKGEVTIGEVLRGGSDISITSSGEIPYPSLRNISGSFRQKISSRFIDATNTNPNNTTSKTCLDIRDITASSNLADSTPSTHGAAVNTIPNASPDVTTPTMTNATKGRLNILVMYFLRIILVFFFLWLPGMIMYYIGYQTDRNGLPHNLAMIFFSLQAIVSNGMALTKPDVKKSIHELWDEVLKLRCYCCRKRNEEGNYTSTDRNGLPHNLAMIFSSLQAIVSNGMALTKPDVKKSIHELWDEVLKLRCYCCRKRNEEGDYTSMASMSHPSPKKTPEKWPEGDVEVPIHEEPYEMRHSDSNSNPSMSRIVTVHHEIANIGGIQVSQLTTHTISSFASSSHVGGNDIPSPRIAHKPKILMPGNSSHSHDDNGTQTEKKKSKKSKKKKDGSSSGISAKRRNSSKRGGKSDSNSLTASPSFSKKKKKSSSSSKSHLPDPPVGPPKRRSSRSGSSCISHSTSDSPVAKAKKNINAIQGNTSPIGQPKQRRGSGSHMSRRGSGSHMSRRGSESHISRRGSGSHISRRGSGSHISRRGSGSHMPRRKSGSHMSRRGSGSHVQKRRSTGSHVPVSESHVAELRKIFNSNEKYVDESPIPRPAQRRSSSSHLFKLNASGLPVAQQRKKFNGNDNDNHENKSPVTSRPGQRRSSGSRVPVVDSSIAQLRKNFSGNDNDESKSSIIQSKRRNSGSGRNASKNNVSSELPFGQSRMRFSDSDESKSEPRRKIRYISHLSKSSVGQPKKEKRISGTSHVRDSPASMKGKRRKKRRSSSKGIFFDGTVIDN